jgi:hypothetical protein
MHIHGQLQNSLSALTYAKAVTPIHKRLVGNGMCRPKDSDVNPAVMATPHAIAIANLKGASRFKGRRVAKARHKTQFNHI